VVPRRGPKTDYHHGCAQALRARCLKLAAHALRG
jgi:hypothetical protein